MNGDVVTRNLTKAEELNKYFSSVFTHEDDSCPPCADIHLNSELTNIVISVEGVEQLLSNIVPHKSSGPDQIPGRLLKLMAHEIAPSLSAIYQASLEQGVMPQDWRNALIVPIFKNGCRSQPSNYRPISLTCIVCKILEHIISTNI